MTTIIPHRSPTLELTRDLIKRQSVTPEDAGCQALLIERLAALGFKIEKLNYGKVSNFWARLGSDTPLFTFAGHTDVVPTGPESRWTEHPFAAIERDGYLWGRGSSDMKGSLAAMITASERFLAANPKPKGSFAFLITSDEEGPAVDGTRRVMQTLEQRGEKIDWCLVGEPSSNEQLGDTVKNGRRGSLSAELIIHGKSGHVAYPHRADNPIHRCAAVINTLCYKSWDQGNEFFPPTTFQISNINGGTGAGNVIPGELKLLFNFRFSTEVTPEHLQSEVEKILQQSEFEYELHWTLFGMPFQTARGKLVDATLEAIHAHCGIEAELSTTGGTSDGRFIAPTGAQVVEFGPINASIHKVDEHVKIADLDLLSTIYEDILHRLLT